MWGCAPSVWPKRMHPGYGGGRLPRLLVGRRGRRQPPRPQRSRLSRRLRDARRWDMQSHHSANRMNLARVPLAPGRRDRMAETGEYTPVEARAQAATGLYEALRAQVSAVTKCWCPPMKGDQHSYVYPDHLEFCESARKAIADYEEIGRAHV